jgi:radical SAM protein (TIGR01212 family)
VAKISLDAGFTCPNIDGTVSRGGCIYCLDGSGSGSSEGLRCQFDTVRRKMGEKWETDKYIVYLQAHSNTYAPLERLRQIYSEVLSFPNVVGLSVATRADCLDEEKVKLLEEISKQTYLNVELGLQSIFDETARKINRGHTFDTFCRGYDSLFEKGIKVCVHLINGLPGEREEDMLENAKAVGALHPDEIKLHLLHVLRGTRLADLYERGEYTPLSEEGYIDIVYKQLLLIPSDIVIGRLTGDGSREALLAPLWSLKKLCVINGIDRKLYENDAYQGKLVQTAQK